MSSTLKDTVKSLFLSQRGFKSNLPRTKVEEVIKLIKQQVSIETSSTQELVFLFLNDLTEVPKCECGNPVKFVKFSKGYYQYCSQDCARSSQERLAKVKDTMIHQYGCANPMHSDVIKLQMKDRSLEKYGVEYTLQRTDVKEKISKTMELKYGSHFLATPSAREKLKFTYKSAARSKKIGEKLKQLRNTTDLTTRTISSLKKNIFEKRLKSKLQVWKDHFHILPEWTEYLGISHLYRWKHEICGKTYQSNLEDGRVPLCPFCKPKSSLEEEVQEFLNTLDISFIKNDRTILKPKELDFFFPDQRVAIELNGEFYHANDYRTKFKTDACDQLGIKLLSFWGHEWYQSPDIVKSMIKIKLGKADIKIDARKCILETIKPQEALKFLDENHLQGGCHGQHHLGLREKNGKLVSVMTLSKYRFGKLEGLEIVRYATCKNTIVRGGFLKLLSQQTDQIYTFLDRRYSSISSYKDMGFSLVRQTSPSFFYFRGGKILSRFQAQKKKLPAILKEKFNEALTEEENMLEAGWVRCYDAGNFLMKRSK